VCEADPIICKLLKSETEKATDIFSLDFTKKKKTHLAVKQSVDTLQFVSKVRRCYISGHAAKGSRYSHRCQLTLIAGQSSGTVSSRPPPARGIWHIAESTAG
jgi:hypothetical protein